MLFKHEIGGRGGGTPPPTFSRSKHFSYIYYKELNYQRVGPPLFGKHVKMWSEIKGFNDLEVVNVIIYLISPFFCLFYLSVFFFVWVSPHPIHFSKTKLRACLIKYRFFRHFGFFNKHIFCVAIYILSTVNLHCHWELNFYDFWTQNLLKLLELNIRDSNTKYLFE